RLTFCLLGVASPSDLIQDTRTTPFNIGRRIELTDFTAEEAAPLAAGVGREPPGSAGVPIPLANSAAYAVPNRRTKALSRVLARGVCISQAPTRTKFSAAAVRRCCKWTFAVPT